MSENYVDSIPRGKNDPPMLAWNPTETLMYDFNDPDSQMVMFNRELEGCVVIPFTKTMSPVPGKTTANGAELKCMVVPLQFGNRTEWWLGIKVGGLLYEYGKSLTVKVSGFRDTDGNEMVPVELRLQTLPKAEPNRNYASHDQIALRAAQDGIVLMKNENSALPLPAGEVLNFFGRGLTEYRICAVGAGKILPRYAVGLLEAARREQNHPVNEELVSFYACGKDLLPEKALLRRAQERSDTAIFVLSRASGESTDNSTRRGEYCLTEDEEALLSALRGSFKRLVVVLDVGYPVGLSFVERYQVDALVYGGFGGMFAGQAMMDVLTGRVNPSGRLPDTWAERYEDIPASRNFYNSVGGKPRIRTDDPETWLDTVYEEDIYVGYRYFESFPNAPRGGYPFGHGLSYTTFARECRSCTYEDGTLTVVVAVRNTGAIPGREVVQIYLSKPQGELEQPEKELVAFEKTILLAPGQEQLLTLTIPESRMVSFHTERSAWVLVVGEYRVFLGGSVRSAGQVGAFRRDALTVVQPVKHRLAPIVPISLMTRKSGHLPTGKRSGVKPGVRSLEPKREQVEQLPCEPLPATDRAISFDDVLSDETLLPEFVGNLDVATLARISVCARDGWGVEGRGEAGVLYRPEGLDLPEFVVADGNSGVNLHNRNIGFPSGATLCASFDRELMERVGQVIGEEAKELGIHLILAPGMNLHRNPLNGRQPEYFSEDPYLAGAMAGSFCKGLESTGTGGCYKHLITNNAESGRKHNQSVVSERAIRELYFRAFQYALEVYEPVSVMTAYNAVNGLFTSCDPELIQGLLYEECGFRGFVMTDWTSYDSADVAQMAIAGNAWITPGSSDDTFTRQIEDAVSDGRLPLARLQDNVRRLLGALVRLNRGRQ